MRAIPGIVERAAATAATGMGPKVAGVMVMGTAPPSTFSCSARAATTAANSGGVRWGKRTVEVGASPERA